MAARLASSSTFVTRTERSIWRSRPLSTRPGPTSMKSETPSDVISRIDSSQRTGWQTWRMSASAAARAELARVLGVGSFLRKDHPLIAHRLRQAAKRGTQIHVLHSVDDDWLMPIASKTIVAPAELPDRIPDFKKVLDGAKNAAVLLGNFAQQHPEAARIHAAAAALGVKPGFLGAAPNSGGGYIAGLPVGGNGAGLLPKPRQASGLVDAGTAPGAPDPPAPLPPGVVPLAPPS